MAKTLTDLDRKLLAALRRDARQSFVHLAEALGTSEGTIRSRVKRLRDTGVIRQFTIRTSGANIKALIDVVLDTNVATGSVADALAAWSGLEAVYETSGGVDLVIVAEADDTEQLNVMIDGIRQLPNVRTTHTRLILKEIF